jgi:HD-GYP domain-containing protein (c-di-GMP phosphodiesterase class II)
MSGDFNIHSLPFLITSLVSFAFPLFVLVKNKKLLVAQTFFLLGSATSLWQFSYFIGYNLNDPSSIYLCYRIAYLGLCILIPALYHFIVSFLGLNKRKFIYGFYAVAAVFAVSVFVRDYFIAGITIYAWGSYAAPGRLHSLFMIFITLLFTLCWRHLYTSYKEASSSYNKRRIKYFLITLPIAYLTMVDNLPIYGIKIYPFGFIFLVFFVLSTSYAIVRYRLFDIEIVIKKMSLIALGFAFSVGLLYIGTLYLQPYLFLVFGRNWFVFPLMVTFLLGFFLFRFINFVRHIAEDELSRKFFYRPILKKETERIAAARSIEELISCVVSDLSSTVGLDYVGVFVFDTEEKCFLLAKHISRSKKSEKISPDTRLSCDDPLVKALIKKQKPLTHSEIEYRLQSGPVSAKEEDSLLKVAGQMQSLGAEISIPSFCEEELLAIMNIGQKIRPGEVITADDLELLASLSNAIGRVLFGFMLQKEKARLIVASQNIVISAVEARDGYTRGHTDRVAGITELLGEKLRPRLVSFRCDVRDLRWSAQLHDVGKIGIPDAILLKPASLTEEERNIIHQHPANGIKIIYPVREWLGEDVCAGILQHHENYDGTGYPAGLKGDDIHIFARIIRVADAFDAMTSDRPYRCALDKKAAFEELKRYKGVHFDPCIVEALQNLEAADKI